MSAQEFESVMSQNTLTAFATFARWKEQMQELVDLGRARSFPVDQALAETLVTLKRSQSK